MPEGVVFGDANKKCKMSEKKRRIFIAVDLPSEVREKLKEVLASLRETGADMRCVKAENTHLTLRFLGGVEQQALDNIKKAMEKALKGITSFDILFHGIGAFPKIETPRVVWLGVREGEQKLRVIRDRLEENLAQIGIEKEGREYHSHLTLARVKSQLGKETLLSWIKSNAGFDLGPMKANKIALMESVLKREGPEYSPLKVVGLE